MIHRFTCMIILCIVLLYFCCKFYICILISRLIFLQLTYLYVEKDPAFSSFQDTFLQSTLYCRVFIVDSLMSTLIVDPLLSTFYFKFFTVDSYCLCFIAYRLLPFTYIVDSFFTDSLLSTLYYGLFIVHILLSSLIFEPFWGLLLVTLTVDPLFLTLH